MPIATASYVRAQSNGHLAPIWENTQKFDFLMNSSILFVVENSKALITGIMHVAEIYHFTFICIVMNVHSNGIQ